MTLRQLLPPFMPRYFRESPKLTADLVRRGPNALQAILNALATKQGVPVPREAMPAFRVGPKPDGSGEIWATQANLEDWLAWQAARDAWWSRFGIMMAALAALFGLVAAVAAIAAL